MAAVATLAGCGGYGEVSPQAYRCVTALYGICNQQADEKLDGLAAIVESSRQRGELTAQESEWLASIVGDARRGDWPSACQACRRMMDDQVKR